jgi:moderate conductance mechanosensitive channel
VLQAAIVQDVFTRIADFLGTSRGLVVEKVVKVVVIWAVAWLAYQVVRRIARRIIAAVDDGDDSTMTAAEKRGHTIAQLVRSVGRVVIVLLALFVTVGLFVDTAPLLAAGGILGLAISFGSQSLVKDLIAGFFILLENQFGVGDVIEVSGKSGTVERMTLRMVQLRDLRGVVHIIPNGQITTVSNQTRSWSRAVVEVEIGYDTDLDTALGIFRDELAKFRQDPAWQARFEGESSVLGVEELGEHGVVVRVLLRTLAGAQWDAAREFRRRIKNRLQAEGIGIAFPQRVVHVRQAPGGAAPGGPA